MRPSAPRQPGDGSGYGGNNGCGSCNSPAHLAIYSVASFAAGAPPSAAAPAAAAAATAAAAASRRRFSRRRPTLRCAWQSCGRGGVAVKALGLSRSVVNACPAGLVDR